LHLYLIEIFATQSRVLTNKAVLQFTIKDLNKIEQDGLID